MMTLDHSAQIGSKVEDMPSYVLGIDLGTNSVGWAVVKVQIDGGRSIPIEILDAGVRIFSQGTEGDISSGKDSSRNVKRRQARQTRRQTDRRRRRKAKIFHMLQKADLLPPGDSIHEVITDLDKQILDKYARDSDMSRHELSSLLVYYLRSRALGAPLDKYELGRVFYHLAQRRGFLSNRRAPVKDDEDLGQVKVAISDLEKNIEASGKRTLGDYFVGVDPHQQRIRVRWTGRSMFEAEFEEIWKIQSKYHTTILTDVLHDDLKRAMFYQRPLKSQKHLVGECELEPGRIRAPKAVLMYQRWRILQDVNNLQLRNTSTGEERNLSPDESRSLIDVLDSGRPEVLDAKGNPTFAKLRKHLHVGKEWKFNLEAADRETLKGNTTAARLRSIFGDSWDDLTDVEKEQVVEDIRSIVSDSALEKRAISRWGLDPAAAKRLAKCTLEDGYASVSLRAIEKTMPLLEEGKTWTEARQLAYPDKSHEALDLLPALVNVKMQSLRTIRNPVVTRSLAELRKVVNAIIRRYGIPYEIHVELARDLKRPRDEREKIWKKQRDQEKKREKAAKKIMDEIGLQQPSRSDIEKVRLAEEQKWVCPYTGKNISINGLIGNQSQFDVDHIIPYSKSFDDSLANKVVCNNTANREKSNRTPLEAFGSDDTRWNDILERVKRFDDREQKWRRFQWTAEDVERRYGGFSERQMNDTRYASRLAADYLGMLYGGRVDKIGKLRIRVLAGGVTAELRRAWGLEAILGNGHGKNRDDHRHHAVDAVAIALTTQGMVKRLSDLYYRIGMQSSPGARDARGRLDEPWSGFLDNVRSVVDNVIPSIQRSAKVRGQLHEETLYSTKQSVTERHIRKSVTSLTKSEIEHITSEKVRDAVLTKIEENKEKIKNAKKAADAGKELDTDELSTKWKNNLNIDDPPTLKTRDGRAIPIKHVRIKVKEASETFKQIGNGSRERAVLTGSNHHIEIFEVTYPNGNVKWEGRIVTLLEAYNRKGRFVPIIDRNWNGDGDGRFLFSLVQGDIIRYDGDLFVVRSFWWDTETSCRFKISRILDARQEKDIPRKGREPMLSGLQKGRCEKIVVDPLGHVVIAND